MNNDEYIENEYNKFFEQFTITVNLIDKEINIIDTLCLPIIPYKSDYFYINNFITFKNNYDNLEWFKAEYKKALIEHKNMCKNNYNLDTGDKFIISVILWIILFITLIILN